jgi:hypothetical protein
VCNSIDGIRTVHGLAQRRFRVIELIGILASTPMTMALTTTTITTMTMTTRKASVLIK